MSVVEIKGVTWDIDGARLSDWQAIQRLYLAGFKDAKVLATAYAVMMGESGRYLEAWHHNCVRDADGNLVRDWTGRFTVNSTDLGFVQRNVLHSPPKKLLDAESQPYVDSLFAAHPELAHGDTSAQIAFALYQDRAWEPWVAYSNGSYKKYLAEASKAVANFLGKVFLDRPNLVPNA